MHGPPAAAPSLGTKGRNVVVEQWALVDGGDSPYQAPELRPIRLTGTCRNHPVVPDGDMTSSNLHMFDEEEGVARSANTQYRLGTPSSEFVDWMTARGTPRPYKFYVGEEAPRCAAPRGELNARKRLREEAEEGEARKRLEEEATEVEEMDSARRWLTGEDWDELHPGVPMSWMTDGQHARWLAAVLARKEERKAEHRAAH